MQNTNEPLEIPPIQHSSAAGRLSELPLIQYLVDAIQRKEGIRFALCAFFFLGVMLSPLVTDEEIISWEFAILIDVVFSFSAWLFMVTTIYRKRSSALVEELLRHRPSFENQIVACAKLLRHHYGVEFSLLQRIRETTKKEERSQLGTELHECRRHIIDAKARFRDAVRVLRALGIPEDEAPFEYQRWLASYQAAQHREADRRTQKHDVLP